MFKNKFIKTIIRICRIVATIILCMMLFNTILQRVFPADSKYMKYRTYNIVTRSMEPELLVGDIILVKKVDPETIKLGDNITFLGTLNEMKNKIVTHKVVSIREEMGKVVFTTKGNSNISIDPDVREEIVFGKVIYKFKLLSLISRLIKTWYGFLFIIVLPLMTLLVTEVIDMRKEIKGRLD